MPTYDTANSQSTYTVPDGVTTIKVEVWGAGGGDGGDDQGGTGTNKPGGNGGYVSGTLPVSPGQTFTVYVGDSGGDGTDTGNPPPGGSGGASPWFNGGAGGDGVYAQYNVNSGSGGGGGGATALVRDSDGAVIAVGEAGGGGGGAHDSNNNYGGGGGGGGARGGIGGASGSATSTAGADAGGSGQGGDGGDGATTYSDDATAGGDGAGIAHGDLSSVSTTTGGGNGGAGQVVITSAPAAPSNLSVDATTETSIDLSWTDNSNNEDGFRIYRGTSSGALSQIDTVGANSTTYTDTGLSGGTTYFYRVEAYNSVGSNSTSEVDGTTVLSAPSNLSIDAQNGDQFDLSWTDNSSSEDGYRVYVSRDGGSTWTQDGSDLAANATSTTTTNLLDGEQYDIEVRAFTSDTESAGSNTVTGTTTLPDEDQPVLGNGVEDEIAVDRETATTDYGDVRLQIRETGQSTWDSNATGFAEQTISHDTLTATFGGLEDGEEYEARVRTETEHATGTWTTPVSIVTAFPTPASVQATVDSPTQVSLSWSDQADNEDGFRVERRRQYGDGWASWEQLADLAPGTESYTDTAASPSADYEYRVTAYTEDATASATVSVTTPQLAATAPTGSRGWAVEVERADGTVRRPAILDSVDYRGALNGLPEIRVPVRTDETWQDGSWDDASMRVWRDGERQPIEEVVDVEDQPGQTVLVGQGGRELDQRVQRDYASIEAHQAAENIITSETTYTATVDDPQAAVTEDTLATASTQESWTNALQPIPESFPATVAGDQLRPLPTLRFQEGEQPDSGAVSNPVTDSQFSGYEAAPLGGGDSYRYTFDWEYPLPKTDWGIGIRLGIESEGHAEFEIRVDGTTIYTVGENTGDPADTYWVTYDGDQVGNGFDLTADLHTVELAAVSSGSNNADAYIDAVVLYDTTRRTPADWASTVNADNYLDSPTPFSPVQIETKDFTHPFNVVGARLDVSAVDTTGDYEIALSPDDGQTWYTETTEEFIDKSFGGSFADVRARFTLGGYGSRVLESPTNDYNPQGIDSFVLEGDTDETPLLIGQKYDDSLINVLQDIADYGDFIFQLQWDGANETIGIEWTKPGQRTADVDDALVDYETSRSTRQAYNRVVVFGAGKPVSGEEFTANHGTAVSLDEEHLTPGEEIVRDPSTGTTYQRGQDYELDHIDGAITTLATGAITDGAALEIDYQYEVQGVVQTGDFDPDQDQVLVEKIPSLTSERGATQAALFLLRRVSEAQWSARVTLQRSNQSRSLVDDIDLSQLPADVPRMEIESIEHSSESITLSLGSRDSVSDIVQRLNNRLAATSKRV